MIIPGLGGLILPSIKGGFLFTAGDNGLSPSDNWYEIGWKDGQFGTAMGTPPTVRDRPVEGVSVLPNQSNVRLYGDLLDENESMEGAEFILAGVDVNYDNASNVAVLYYGDGELGLEFISHSPLPSLSLSQDYTLIITDENPGWDAQFLI